jgi:hypothetical protein
MAIGAGCLFPNNGNPIDYRKYIWDDGGVLALIPPTFIINP